MLAVCGLALLACRRCPEPPFSALASGSFHAVTSGGTRDPSFPHHGTTLRTIEVDRAKNIVTIRYRRGTDDVVERWRIKSSSVELH